MKKILFLILLVLVCLSVAVWFVTRTEKNAAFYRELQQETDTYIETAYIPGADSNPIRAELNRMLGEVLSVDMTDAQRLERARHGLFLIEQLETQIDAIGETKGELQNTLAALDAEVSHLPTIFHGERGRVQAIADRLYVIVDDIRGLSYRANFHTSEIFERIVRDDGALTPSHVTSLNDQIPQVEEQFDRRSNLYNELESLDREADALYASLSQVSTQARIRGLFSR